MNKFLRVMFTLVLSPLILVALLLGVIGIILATLILGVFGVPLVIIIWILTKLGMRKSVKP